MVHSENLGSGAGASFASKVENGAVFIPASLQEAEAFAIDEGASVREADSGVPAALSAVSGAKGHDFTTAASQGVNASQAGESGGTFTASEAHLLTEQAGFPFVNFAIGSTYTSGAAQSVYGGITVGAGSTAFISYMATAASPLKVQDGGVIIVGYGGDISLNKPAGGGNAPNDGILEGGTATIYGAATNLGVRGGTVSVGVAPGQGTQGGRLYDTQDFGGTVILGAPSAREWGGTHLAWSFGQSSAQNSAHLIVSNGGIAYNDRIWQGGKADIGSGGTASNLTVKVGSATIYDGGIVSGLTVMSDCLGYTGNKDGIASDLIGQATVLQGGTVVGGTVWGGNLDKPEWRASVVVQGLASDLDIGSAGSKLVDKTGLDEGGKINSGGMLSVFDGGSGHNELIASGGKASIYGDGSVNHMSVAVGGTGIIGTNGLAVSGTANGTVLVSGGTSYEGNIWQSGFASIYAGGTASDLKVMVGTAYIGAGGTVSNITANMEHANNNGGIDRGLVVVESGGTVSGANLNPQTSPDQLGQNTAAGGVLSVHVGGMAYIDQNAGGTIILGGAGAADNDNKGVVINGLGDAVSNGAVVSVTTEIRQFDGPDKDNEPTYDWKTGLWNGGDSDGLVLSGVQRGDIVGIYSSKTLYTLPRNAPKEVIDALTGPNGNDYEALRTKSGGWIIVHVQGIGNRGVLGSDPNDPNSIVFEICFLEGTGILTPKGYRKIEMLRPGDEITVAEPDGSLKGRALPLKWIGKKKMQVAPEQALSLPPDVAGYAVRVRKGAFGQNVPERDLWATPEHCFFFEGRLVPLRMLVNGKTIAYDTSRPTYRYYHLETEPHALLIAEGALAETYLDTGNRHQFVSVLESEEDRPDQTILRFRPRGEILNADKSWQSAVAPLEVSRDFVENLWRRLAERAGISAERVPACNLLGEKVTKEADFGLFLRQESGEQVKLPRLSQKRDGDRQSEHFMLPASAKGGVLVLKSRTSRPCDSEGPFVDDRRHLGVLVSEVSLRSPSGEVLRLENYLKNPDLKGWAGLESCALRWTAGEAELPLPPVPHGALTVCVTFFSQKAYWLSEAAQQESVRLEKAS